VVPAGEDVRNGGTVRSEEGHMAKKTHAERRAAGLEVQSTLRGGGGDPEAVAAAMEARLGPLGSFVIDFALGDVWTRTGLPRRERSLVVLSILTTLNQLNQLRAHVRGGVNHGLTRTEIEEVFVQLAAYAGFPGRSTG
jgi:4-carboxymuconolactone decarboxylase